MSRPSCWVSPPRIQNTPGRSAGRCSSEAPYTVGEDGGVGLSWCNFRGLFPIGKKRENRDARTSRFPGRLRELREAAGLSRQQLADKAGLKLGGVRNLEQG